MAAARKLLLFHPKASKSTGELQRLLQGEVLSQAAKWVAQAKSLWSTQHPAQSLKSCRKLAGGLWGTVNQPALPAAVLRNAAGAVPAPQHGLAPTGPGLPQPAPGNSQSLNPALL